MSKRTVYNTLDRTNLSDAVDDNGNITITHTDWLQDRWIHWVHGKPYVILTRDKNPDTFLGHKIRRIPWTKLK